MPSSTFTTTPPQRKSSPRARARVYNNVEVDAEYIDKFRKCCTASDLAKVVVEMVRDESIPYLDAILAVKAEFFTRLLPLCPNLKKGITESNIRVQINKELAVKPKIPYRLATVLG